MRAIHSIQEFCRRENITENFWGKSIRELVYWFKPIEANLTNERLIAIKDELADIIIQDFPKNTRDEEGADFEPLAKSISSEETGVILYSSNQTTQFFTRGIRYLGPLRADPNVSQRFFSPTNQLDDVGLKGEYAPVVYHYNQLASIEWYNPYNKCLEQGTLQEALDSWSKYLGVAEQITTEIAGAMGVIWRVVLREGQIGYTLPEVGVGISQVLPILVMGLLSPVNTLLIVEQPELHLHPGVQARLGDFFVGMSTCKKQFLIETHSENLVSQLRYHIVQAGGMENSDCMIYFVDQDERGAAKFDQVEISPQGNILNWPDGFFDETMRQEDRITAASLRKRAHKVKNG